MSGKQKEHLGVPRHRWSKSDFDWRYGTTKLNNVQTTILEQLSSLDPLWRIEYRVETIVTMDDNTLRLCCRTKERMVNFDIKYKPSPDTYDVTAYLLWNHGIGYAKIVEVTDVYWDSLADLLREAHQDVPTCNQCGKSVKPGTGRFVNRVPSFDNAQTRFETGYPHPEGDFTCAECDQNEGNCSSDEHLKAKHAKGWAKTDSSKGIFPNFDSMWSTRN